MFLDFFLSFILISTHMNLQKKYFFILIFCECFSALIYMYLKIYIYMCVYLKANKLTDNFFFLFYIFNLITLKKI